MSDPTQSYDEPESEEPWSGRPAETLDDLYRETGAEAEVTNESRDEQLDRLRRDVDEANKRTLQAQAEAENFRKRMRRDVEDQLKYAAVGMVLDILQVRDNLHRAIDAAASSGEDAAAGLRDGVAMVAKQLDDALAKHGVIEIPAQNEPFNPELHNAISQMPGNEVAAGHVLHVAASGFKMHERVIRPSQVIVSTGPANA